MTNAHYCSHRRQRVAQDSVPSTNCEEDDIACSGKRSYMRQFTNFNGRPPVLVFKPVFSSTSFHVICEQSTTILFGQQRYI